MQSDQDLPTKKRSFRVTAMGILTFVAMVIMLIAFFLMIGMSVLVKGQAMKTDLRAIDMIFERFPVVVGLPFAALFSLFLVTFLQQTTGPIEVKVIGVEFKGPSGKIVLWLVCFLGIAAAIKLLW